MSHGACVYSAQQPCRAGSSFPQVEAHAGASRVTNTNESWHSCPFYTTTLSSSSLHVMAHMRMGHVTHLNESWHSSASNNLVVLVSACHGTHENESCHTFE